MIVLPGALVFLLLAIPVYALPYHNVEHEQQPITIPILRKGIERHHRTVEQWQHLATHVKNKFGANVGPERRSTVTVSITNRHADTVYYGTLLVGTPPKPFDVILDTGSADLWFSSSECKHCDGTARHFRFDSSESSSFKPTDGNLSITYGSGDAHGTLGTDNISFGGFQVPGQPFGLVTSSTDQILSGSMSGILGLALGNPAYTAGTPWWVSASSSWLNPQMSFYLTRFRDIEGASRADEAGGQFTMGGTNASLYEGNLNFVSLNLNSSRYWAIPLCGLGINNGSTIEISNAAAAIDTGTTLIGGPSSVLEQFYAQIPGAFLGSQIDSGLNDYYVIPCDTNVQATLTFGGQTYTMHPSDLVGGTVSDSQCLGAFFKFDAKPGQESSSPTWVIGSAFLKNVYTVFQSEPPAVGFATLKRDIPSFGSLGLAGFAIDENGNTNATIIRSATSAVTSKDTIGLALLGIVGLLLVGASI